VNKRFSCEYFLSDKEDRKRSQQEIRRCAPAARPREFNGARVKHHAGAQHRRGSAPVPASVQFVIQSPDLDTLREVLPKISGRSAKEPGVHVRRQRSEIR